MDGGLSLLQGDRPPVKITFTVSKPPIGGSRDRWETWAHELLSDCPEKAPRSVSEQIDGWLQQALRLELDVEGLWTVDDRLRSFDSALSRHLQTLVHDSADITRRLAKLTSQTLLVGRQVPARKVLSMIMFFSIRNPGETDGDLISEWALIWNTGKSLDEAALFLENVADFCSRMVATATTTSVVSYPQITARVVGPGGLSEGTH